MQNKCMVCDKPLDSLAKSFVDSAKNIYESKAVSQLYYDIIVPYDTGSRHEMMRMGYDDPERSLVKVNDQLRNDVQAFIVRNGLTLLEFRRLDNPSAYFPEIRQRPEGHPFSRVIDKVFYTP